MEFNLMTILALLVGIVLGVVVILVINAIRNKGTESKANKLIEQAKKEAIQEGKTFDPNEYERERRQRIEENAMSPITIILILGGIVLVLGGIVSVVSNISDKLKTPEGKYWMVILGVIVVVLLVVFISVLSKGPSGSNYDSDKEYWENARMHTD